MKKNNYCKFNPKEKIFAFLCSIVLLFSFLSFKVQAQATADYKWKSVRINGGGYVTGIIYSPTQQNLVYARTDVGGAYRWDVTNKVWIPLSDGFAIGNDYGVVSLATDPSDPNRVYMATGMYTQSWGETGAVYSSTDKGNTWTRNNLSIKLGGNEGGRAAGERLQVDPNLGSILFLGSSTDGLWKSTNYGSTWNKVNSFPVSTSPIGSGGISFVLFDKSSSSSGTATSTIYVGVMQTGTNLYKSTDGGSTWTAVPDQPVNMMPRMAALASNGMIYLAYSDANGPNNVRAGAVWKLNPGNNTWTDVSPPAGQGGYGGISVDAQNPNHLIVGTMGRWSPGDGVFRTTDGGANWTNLKTNATWDHSLAPYATTSNPHWIGDVDIDPFNSQNAWFVTGYGLYNSNNLTASSTHWIFQNNGLEETAANELISPPSGAPLLSALGDQDGFKHDNLDVSPPAGRSTQYGTNKSIDFAQNLPSFMARVYNNAGGNYGSYSTDGGNTWIAFSSVPSGASGGGNIAVSADGNRIVWAPQGASALYYSTNQGSSWTASSGSIPAGLKPVSDRVNSQKFYAYDGVNGKVWVSTNGGVSFSEQASNLPMVPSYQAWLTRIRTVFGVEGDIWLANPSGLYRSTNSGTSFTQVTNVESAITVSFGKAASGETYPAVFIVGTVNGTYGFYRSDDSGATWVRINDNQHQYGTVSVITGDPRVYGRLYLGGNGRGIIYGDIACTPSTIISYLQIDGGTWQQTASASVTAGGSLKFGPQPNTGGSWSWSGPNNFSASTREVTLSNIQINQAGSYVATYTNSGGCQSTQTFNVTVTTPIGGGSGTILREYWTGISGTSISSLTSNANYPNSSSGSEQLTSLEGSTNWADNYGTRIRGYIHPTTSGSYTFWIAGDDNAELYLSTDANPANATRIAYVNGWTNSKEWSKYSTQQSGYINLVTGQKYYVEVLHKEGSGGDNVAVAWQGPGITQQVIGGSFLSPYNPGSIVVRARGTNGDETINLRVDGNTVATWKLGTAYADYTASGSGVVTVHFTNDGSNRDVQIDYVTIGGVTYQSENQAVNTGVWSGTCGGSNSEWLNCGGYISYTSGSSSKINSEKSEALEEVVLSVDEVNLYPNPAYGGKFSIEFPETSQTVNINIFDMQGKMLYERVFDNSGKLDIDSGLKSGIYIVKAFSEGFSVTKKLIVR